MVVFFSLWVKKGVRKLALNTRAGVKPTIDLILDFSQYLEFEGQNDPSF